MMTLDGGRIGIASQALGIAQGALDETVAYVKERKQFGRTIANFQNTQFQLANLEVKVEASRLLVYKAAWRESNHLPYSVDAARAKLFASETAMEVTTKAVQLHGGYGYTREYPVERMMRDAKITEIYEGTSEVQRMVIAGSLLSENNPLFTEEMRLTMVNVDDPGKLSDFVTSMINADRASQQEILETFDVQDRLEKVLLLLQKESEITKIQQKIQGSIKKSYYFFII